MNIAKQRKVLIVSEVFAPEEFLINDLVFSWKQEGYLVSVLTRNPSYPYGKIYPGYKNRIFQKEIIKDVPVYRVQFIPGYKNNRFIKILNYIWNMVLGCIWAIKNGNRFDSIFIYHTGPLTFASIGALINKLYKKKTTIWTQDVWPDTVHAYGLARKGLSSIILNKFVKWIYSNCDIVIVSSPGYIPIISKYCPQKEIQYIPQWSLTSRLTEFDKQQERPELPGKFNFIFAGNIGEIQNLENVITGFEIFLNNTGIDNIWLNLVGDGSHYEYLQEHINKNNIRNIKFWGRKNIAEIPYFYEKADVLIISLENKAIFNLIIPAKFQSYLNAEKPIFGIIIGIVATLIKNNNLGWVASPDNIQEIADSFTEIAQSNQNTFIEKTRNASILLESQFNREKNILAFTEIVFH